MKIIEAISDLEKIEKGCVLTIGNFDGVHIGHQEILTAAKKTAAQKHTELVAMTFEPHPVTILHPEKSPGVLTPLSLKSCFLAKSGADSLVVLESTVELLRLSAEDFVNLFLVEAMMPSVVVEGRDFNFGYQRTGNLEKLQQLGAEKGFEVCVIEPKNVKLSAGETIRVSSTVIRHLLESGRVTDAAIALGRPYRLLGQVVPGHGKGKQLGFPTANLEPGRQIIPAEAVYAGFVEIGDTAERLCQMRNKIPAALSIGTAQTLAADRPQMVEAHLLTENVPGLTGKFLAVDFVKYLRRQIKFENEKQLAVQIAKDCEKAKEILVTKNL